MIDVFTLSVEEMASKIKEGQLTSVEVCEQYIERINKFEKDIKAWAHFDKKILLEIFKGIMPFLGIVIFGMFLMYMFPAIALWLPDVLFAD